MLSLLRQPLRASSTRLFSTSPVHFQVSRAKLVAEIRRRTDNEVSISKARDALAATGDDIEAAFEWLQKDLAASGAKKAAKVADRATSEGMVSMAILGESSNLGPVRAAIVELNCETDFVARNALFGKLACDIAHTAATIAAASPKNPFEDPQRRLLREVPIDLINDALLLSHSQSPPSGLGSVSSAIRDIIAKVGENITLRRVAAIVEDTSSTPTASLRLGHYVHGAIASEPSSHTQAGRVGGIVALGMCAHDLPLRLATEKFNTDLSQLTRALARQTVGFETRSIRPSSPPADPAAVIETTDAESTALYEQQFVMNQSSHTVHKELRTWAESRELRAEDHAGVDVVDFVRWKVGEAIEA
ncbi:hypothetical protein BOTBODRAFT_108325 [Botryobasidium botryosum FD-172 SS1]|uniref:Elongation factor Ts, mitochondrial n=1 Tax=Botryobasidium botryosum (strain FD-172 SS1) TaxID=930990 RepID=A0A067MLU5_BOTB1|nr:hypothetical protein BOTBODRAFT_108325 [Botryobasidium botryosum FD-172 SS1]